MLLLAPMFDVTDTVYRSAIMTRRRSTRVVAAGGGSSSSSAPAPAAAGNGFHDEQGAGGTPDVVFTEFVSADGLCHPEGRTRLLPMLRFDARAQRPCVAQLFGRDPNTIERAAAMCVELGFDAIDLNFGCPDAAVVKRQGAGAALIREPDVAVALVAAAKRGAAGALPVSVKTRAGFSSRDELEPWVSALLSAEPAALTLHARTARELSKADADWGLVARAAALARGTGTPVFGNGDVASTAHAAALCAEHGADGAMIGRGVLTNPWFFEGRDVARVPADERFGAVLQHLEAFAAAHGGGRGDAARGDDAFHQERKAFTRLKKCFRGYFHSMPGGCARIKEAKRGLHAANTAVEAIEVARAYLGRDRRRDDDDVVVGGAAAVAPPADDGIAEEERALRSSVAMTMSR